MLNSIMTKALQQAIERLQKVPAERQDAFAAMLIHELDEDERWTASTSEHAEKLRGLISGISDVELL
jgi:hypothetical protein